MPTTVQQPPAPTQRQFTVDEYYRMGEAGVFGDDDRVELLDGHIYTMTPIGSEHAACVDRLNRLFVLRVGDEAIVRIQNPLRLDEASEPEPDVALLSPREDDYGSRHPRPEDVFLVVEVADSSVSFDRNVKRPLYARAGIPVFWIVALNDERVEVYSEPEDDGYATVHRYERGQTIPVGALPDLESIAVDALLGTTDD